ncbi:MAG: hypothetical protein ACKVQC_06035 [Elusimicrobiota bacterium]
MVKFQLKKKIAPFGLNELLAGVKALLRRARPVVTTPAVTPAFPPQSTEEKNPKNEPELHDADTPDRPHLFNLVKRFFSVLLSPAQSFDHISSRSDMLISVLAVIATAVFSSLGSVSKPNASFDLWIGDFSLALVVNVLLWLSTSGLLVLVLPFAGIVLPTSTVICAAGLAWAPRLLGASLSALYALLASGMAGADAKPFFAGLYLIPGLPTASWVEALSSISVFDVWAAFLVVHAFRSFRKVSPSNWDGLTIFVGGICVLWVFLKRHV